MPDNQQPIEAVMQGDGKTLDVHSIFPTIQGEGPFAGRPAVFLRLAGCNLRCPLCDTDYTTNRKKYGLSELMARLEPYRSNALNLLVITGGEPFRQNIETLCFIANVMEGWDVQIETNGKLPPHDNEAIPEDVVVVVSPKTATIHPWMAARADAFKYVIRHGDVAPDGLPIGALNHPLPAGKTVARPPEDYDGVVYVQPADEKDPEKNRDNMDAAINSVLHFCNHSQDRRLCLQLHKIAGLE